MELNDLVSAEVIGAWTDLHERQVRKLAERGVIERDGRGRYQLQATVRAIVVRAREQAAGRLGGDDGDTPDLAKERALLARAQREFQIMKNDILRSELLPAALVDELVGRLLAVLRTSFLGLPTKASPLLIGLQSVQEICTVLTSSVHRVLEAIADGGDEVKDEIRKEARRRAGSSDHV